MKPNTVELSLKLEQDLLLSLLSKKKGTKNKEKLINDKQLSKLQTIDLTAVNQIDSAGLAQLALWKSKNNSITFIGYSKKIMLLSHLYGLDFLFK
jgi:ABC-type transporter Mla MlaB component